MDGASGRDIACVLADFVLSNSYEKLPSEAVVEAKKAILDCIGVAIAGSETEIGSLICEFVCDLKDQPLATILGKGIKASPLSAALANGVMAHALDFDDSSISLHGHPSSPLLPALLAVGEDRGISGKELLTAYILGYEIETKLGRGVNVNHNNKGWHTTSTLGIFGATAGVGKILGLNQAQMVAAFGIACSESSGSKQNFGTMTKSFHAGNAARNAVTAALLAHKNFNASTTPFEGKYGFFSLYCDPGRYDIGRIVDNLGNPFDLLAPGVIIKPYPCCGSTHAAIDALKIILRSNPLPPEEIKAIDVGVSFVRPKSLRYDDPRSVLQSKFSMPFCLAVTVLDGNPRLSDFTEMKLFDGKMRELMPKIRMYVHPDLSDESSFNYDQEFVLVSVRLKDGREFTHRLENVRRKGSRLNPLTLEEIKDKYRDCTRRILSSEKVEAALNLLEHLEEVADIRELTGFLQADFPGACRVSSEIQGHVHADQE